MRFADLREGMEDITPWYRLLLLEHDGTRTPTHPVSSLGAGAPGDAAWLRAPEELGAGGPIRVRFGVGARDARVTLAVFDVRGRLVRLLVDELRGAGEHAALWDRTSTSGARASRGVYLFGLRTSTGGQTRKLVLVHD